MQGDYSVWTNARIAQLTELWAQRDYSATTIGVAMGMSRNAILGKAFRLKLPSRKPPASAAKGPRVFVARSLRPPKEVGTDRAAPVSPITGGWTLMRKRPRVAALTKDQLRAQLTQAVINTGGVR